MIQNNCFCLKDINFNKNKIDLKLHNVFRCKYLSVLVAARELTFLKKCVDNFQKYDIL